MLGLQLGKLEERLSLYADNALLYLNGVDPSLLAALHIFNTFGGNSGIRINWAKSILFPLDEGAIRGRASTPLRWVQLPGGPGNKKPLGFHWEKSDACPVNSQIQMLSMGEFASQSTRSHQLTQNDHVTQI